MNDAEAMRFFEYVADLRGDVDRPSRGKSSFARECLRQSFTFNKLHHDKVTSIRQIARVEDHCGVRMMELCHGPRFAQKSDRKSTRLNSSHSQISYAVFCLKKKNRIA